MDLDLLRVPRLIARAIAVTVADYAAMIHAASQTARTASPRAAARQPADATPPRGVGGHPHWVLPETD